MPIDELSFKYTLYPIYRHQDEFYQAAQKNEESNLDEQVNNFLTVHNIDKLNITVGENGRWSDGTWIIYGGHEVGY